MFQSPWFYHINLAVVWVGVVAILGLCALVGYRLGVRAGVRVGEEKRRESPTFVASSTLGLLALILGFTFSMAIARFESRRQLVVDEANAIGTTYLRASLLRTPAGLEIRDLLKQYVEARIAFYEAPATQEGFEIARKSVQSLQARVWKKAEDIVRVDRGAIESIFINSLNSMIDLENSRSIALAKTLPEIIYWVILITAGSGLCALEFARGMRGEMGNGWTMLFVAIVSCVFVMIQDLERPRSGAIRITQDAMIALRDSFKSE